MKRLLAFLTVLVLLPVFFSAAEEGTETEAISGPVGKTIDEINAMLDGSESITRMIDEPFYENVKDEDAALEAMGSVMDRLGCDDTTRLVLESVRPTEDGMTYYTFKQKAGDLAVYGGAAKLIVNKNGTAVAAVATVYRDMPDTENIVWEITEEGSGGDCPKADSGRSCQSTDRKDPPDAAADCRLRADVLRLGRLYR